MKYHIGELVECINTQKSYTVKDYENFGNCKLYYFECGLALPEDKIVLKGVSSIKRLFSVSEEYKQKKCSESLKKLKDFTDNYGKKTFTSRLKDLLCL